MESERYSKGSRDFCLALNVQALNSKLKIQKNMYRTATEQGRSFQPNQPTLDITPAPHSPVELNPTQGGVTNTRIAKARARIHQIVETRQAQLAAQPDIQPTSSLPIAHANRRLHKAGEFVGWMGFGMATRAALDAVSATAEIVGKPVAMLSAVVVRSVRDTVNEYQWSHKAGGRYFFQRNVGEQAYRTRDQKTKEVKLEDPAPFWAKTKAVAHLAQQGLVDKYVKKGFHSAKYKSQLAEIKISDNTSLPELITHYKTAKLALDTATTYHDRQQARTTIKQLYAAINTESTQQSITSAKLKQMMHEVNDTLDTHAQQTWAKASVARVAHTPITAALPAFLGATIFENYLSKWDVYQNAKHFVSAKFSQLAVSVQEYLQTSTSKPEISAKFHPTSPRTSTVMPEQPTGGGKVFAKTAISEELLQPSKPITPQFSTPATTLAIETVNAPVTTAPALPTSFTVEKGQGVFHALVEAGFKVTQDNTAEAFLKKIGIPVFNLSHEQVHQLQAIIDQHPNISADKLRTIAISQGIDFDHWFAVKAQTYEIPVAEPQPATPTHTQIHFMEMNNAYQDTTYTRPNGLAMINPDTPQPQPKPPTPPNTIQAAGVPLRGNHQGSLRAGGANISQAAGVSIQSPTRLRVAGVSITESVPAAGVSMTQTSNLTAGAVELDIIDQPTPQPVTIPEQAPQVETNAQPLPVEALPRVEANPFNYHNLDWSPENAKNIKFSKVTAVINGQEVTLFDFKPHRSVNRIFDPNLQIELNELSNGDIYIIDERRGNVFLFVHSWGDYPAEGARQALEGGNNGVPERTPWQMDYIAQQLEQQQPVTIASQLSENGTTFTRYQLTNVDIINHTDTQSIASNLIDTQSQVIRDSQGHPLYTLFDHVKGNNRLYIINCGSSHSEALNMLRSALVSQINQPGFPINAWNDVLSATPSANYKQNLYTVLDWVYNNDSATYSRFAQLFDYTNDSPGLTRYQKISYIRHIWEFTPQNAQ